MRFGVLGPLEFTTAAGAPVAVPELKVRVLLAALLVHRGRPVSTDRLVDHLWGTDPPAHPLAALRTKVSRLRQAIGPGLVVATPPGRATAVADLRSLLGAHRLVTLTGPGGVGKTRLAVEVASAFPVAWLVEATADGLADAVAAELGVPVTALADALRERELVLVLVLDNCERAVDEVAALAATLLPTAPRLRVLVTSQVPLDVGGEVRYEVAPLPEADAAELFLARAAATGYRTEDVAAVRTLCRRLDGLPLAVELAAARVRALGVTELLARLDDRFRLLTKGKRDAPARQRTLRAVLDWSWEPLSAPERAVLRRLAVHAGGCTLAAAEAVCAGPDVADVLDALVDRSLVVVRDGRFRPLESVTAYCLDRLAEAGETTVVHKRHREYYTELAERADLRGPGQREWLARLDEEYQNLRAALDGEPNERLSRALSWYWLIRGRFTEARRYLSAGEDPLSQWFLGYVLFRDGQDLAESERLVGRALAGFRAEADEWGVAAALAVRAGQSFVHGDLAACAATPSRATAGSPHSATAGGGCRRCTRSRPWRRSRGSATRRRGSTARACGWPRSWTCTPTPPTASPGSAASRC